MSFRVIYRKEKLLEELINHEGYVTSAYLSSKFGISSRTIRKDIKQLSLQLQEKGIELSAVPSKGFHLDENDREKAYAYLEAVKRYYKNIPSLPADRMKFIIRKLLFEGEHLNTDDLSKELFVSPSTIEKDLIKVGRWFSNHGLDLVNKREGGIFLTGSEILTRYAMVNYFSGLDDSTALPNLKNLTDIIGEEYVEPIINLLYDVHYSQNVSSSDAEFLNLIIYLSVSLLRISENKGIKQAEVDSSSVKDQRKFALASEIAVGIKRVFSVELSQTELIHLTKYLMQINIITADADEYVLRDEKSLSRFINKMIKVLNSEFNLDFSNDKVLRSSLKLYIHSLINRKMNRTLVKNPGLGEIAAQYPDALEMAVFVSEKLKDAYDLTLNEHEIGYIALYFCAAFERQKTQKDRAIKKVAIICVTGSGGSQLLAVKIKRNFQNLNIVGVYPAYRLSEALKQNPDFIISTTPIKNAGCPVVHISHVLNDDDLINIRKALDEYDHKKHLELSSLFHPELFFTEVMLTERTDVINFLCDRIKAQGYVDDSFASMVLEREAIFSTAVGNLVAIPHALTNKHGDSWIAVGLLKRPILWGNDPAQLILLLNINNAAEDNFNTIYEMLYDMVNDKRNIGRILRTTKFDEFLKVING